LTGAIANPMTKSDLYPFNAGYNPTGPLAALPLRLGDDLNDYIARPRHL
jgi:gluconate 2-dehydrogenase alpha chain